MVNPGDGGPWDGGPEPVFTIYIPAASLRSNSPYLQINYFTPCSIEILMHGMRCLWPYELSHHFSCLSAV
jgi:hypothetical protein